MIDPLIFAAYLIVAGVGSVFAVSQLIRIARKGGPHGTRSRAAAERLDLFPPDVELGAVLSPNTQSYTEPEPEPVAVAYPDGHRADLHAVSSAIGDVFDAYAHERTHSNAFPCLDCFTDGYAKGFAGANGEPDGLRERLAIIRSQFLAKHRIHSHGRTVVLRNGDPSA